MRQRRLLPALLAIVLAGCASGGPSRSRSASVPPSAAPSDEAATPAATLSASSSPSPTATHFESSVDGLTLSADLDRAAVAPGGTLTVRAVVRNDRSVPVTYTSARCEPIDLTVPLPRPLDPPGKTWTGVAGQFKSFVLEHGSDPRAGEAGAAALVNTPPPALCSTPPATGLLAPGGSLERTISWQAELTPGVPALPGPVDFHLVFYSTSPGGAAFSPVPWMQQFIPGEVVLDGRFEIAGPARPMLSVGQAIDAMLADPKFAAWLPAQADWDWSANLMLQTGDGSAKYLPKGPAWDIELFPTPKTVPPNTDTGKYRRFARGFIDPFDGKILLMDICDNPCHR